MRNEAMIEERAKKAIAYKENDLRLTILVVEDIEETRDGIEMLLKADGYRVEAARNEQYAVESAWRRRPDLILVGLGGTLRDVIATAHQIRERANLGNYAPVVGFCMGEVDAGDEIAVGQNIYVTCPDNFNQLRNLLARLLHKNRMLLEEAMI
jgi:CheY-like chemotaxis protein